MLGLIIARKYGLWSSAKAVFEVIKYLTRFKVSGVIEAFLVFSFELVNKLYQSPVDLCL